ncbi:cyclase family protein [Phreatobacter stygius]|uniref:Cyclase family protein n=1 Tax=Phreatobacter stygius TaxID=1940610 RepID=A0A4D7BH44_9HYPH|nr:cyclase family protein [Phreatobacter stygius]QCI67117.1 cyclase family protein [Phreatobacter stygius]
MTVRDPKDLAEQPNAPERRDFLKGAAVGGVVAAASLHVAQMAVTPAQAQTPAVQPWWPSRWGADDQIGATNHITPQKVLEAAQWIRDGKIYRIGRMSEAAMPKFGDRAFTLRIPGNPTGGPFAGNKLVYNDEYLATEIGQTGTQFDGLAHIGVQLGKDGDTSEMAYYNGVRGSDMVGSTGMKKLGIENVKPIFTRGHLIDVMAQRGGMMDVGQEVTLADVRGALAKQNMNENDIKPGDALFFNTGWGSLWMRNNDRYGSGEPGPGLEVARWAIEKQIVVMGGDSWGVEAVPNPDRNLAFPVHAELITKNGIHVHENLQFDALIADRKYQFVYIFSPIPIKGATGSPGGPIAVT